MNRITAKIDENEIFILNVKMQDPSVALQMTDTVLNFLENYIRFYQSENANDEMKVIFERQTKAETRLHEMQSALAHYRDQHGALNKGYSQEKEEQLKSSLKLAGDLYYSLSLQLEQAQMKIAAIWQKQVFQVFDAPKVSLAPPKPRSCTIIAGLFIIGLVVGIGIVLGKDYFRRKYSPVINEN